MIIVNLFINHNQIKIFNFNKLYFINFNYHFIIDLIIYLMI